MLKENAEHLEHFQAFLVDYKESAPTYLYHAKKFLETLKVPLGQVQEREVLAYLNLPNIKKQKVATHQLFFSTLYKMFSSLKFKKQKLMLEELRKEVLSKVRKEQKVPVHLSVEAVRSLMKTKVHVRNDLVLRDELIVYLFYSAGLRASELRNLKIDDLRLGEKTTGNKVITIKRGKGKKDRDIVVSQSFFERYEEYYNFHRGLSPFAFTTQNGYQLSYLSVYNVIAQKSRLGKGSDKEGGIRYDGKYIHPHNLRSSFASEVYSREKDLLKLQELLGHASPNTTKVYTKISREELKKTKLPEL